MALFLIIAVKCLKVALDKTGGLSQNFKTQSAVHFLGNSFAGPYLSTLPAQQVFCTLAGPHSRPNIELGSAARTYDQSVFPLLEGHRVLVRTLDAQNIAYGFMSLQLFLIDKLVAQHLWNRVIKLPRVES